MWQYGKRIIDNLIKRRTKRPPVCAELESRSEADSDRSDIGMFEVGLSAEQHGNYEQGTGNAAQEEEGNRLKLSMCLLKVTMSLQTELIFISSTPL